MNKALLLSVLAIFASHQLPVYSGTYGPQNFDSFAVGIANLNDGSTLASNTAGVASVQNRRGSATDRALRLTVEGTGNTLTAWKLPVLDTATEIESFDVSFKAEQFSTDTLADGFSLTYGAIPGGNDFGGGEAGFTVGNGLVISFDSYANFAGDAPRIKVFSNGVQVGIATVAFNLNDSTFHNVVIHWDANGLDLTYDTTAVFTNLALPGFSPAPGDRFAFSARTGGANQETMIDDMQIATVTPAPLTTTDVVITEFLADNGDGIEDEDADTSDWIEIYNGTGSPVDLTGWRLTNLPSNANLWTFPSMTLPSFTYLRIFASGKDRREPAQILHTNFTLIKDGGYLALVKPDGVTKASEFVYGAQSEDVSYGTYGQDQVRQFMIPPTPGARNERSLVEHADGAPAEDVVFTRDGGLVTAPVQLGVVAPQAAGAVIRYTVDGTVPDAADPVFDPATPLTISTTRNVRARVFQAGRLPGDLNARAFLFVDASLTNYANTGQPFSSNLPIVVVESWGVNIDSVTNPAGPRPYRPIHSVVLEKDPTNGNRARITGPVNFEGRGGMHVRGQTSASFGQRPYAWELWTNEDDDKDFPLLGLPSDSDWILQTPYNDKCLIRNPLPYELMYETRGPEGAVRNHFVEVFFNQDGGPVSYADYRGVYILMERIKRSTDRVDISELSPLATNPATITGGYIFKKDKLPVAPMYTTTTSSPWGGQIHEIVEPEDANTAQISYMQNYVQQFENALAGGNFRDPTAGYRAFIDPDSFIDNHLWVEVFKQIDGYRISTYFTKDRDQKIKALPIWDYNLSSGNANYLTGENPQGWYYTNIGGGDYPYYSRLFQDPEFQLRYWDRYWAYRRTIFTTENIHSRIDAFVNELTDNTYSTTNVVNGAAVNTGFGNFHPTDKANNFPPSMENPPRAENPAMRHFDRWPILGVDVWPNAPGYATRTTYQAEVSFMKTWIANRLNWIDGQFTRPPLFSHAGGNVSSGTQLTITNPNASGTIYYTVNGTDPRPSTPTAQTLTAESGLNCQWLVPTSANGGFSLTAAAGDQQWTGLTDPPNIASWTAATTALGYDRNTAPVNYLPLLGTNANTESQMFNINATIYVRVPFNIPDQATLDSINKLFLGMRYDDGFRAYINGTQVGGRNDTHASMTSTPWTAVATTAHDDAQSTAFEDIDVTVLGKPALRVGTNILAIHGLNSPAGSSDFLLSPRLTYITAAAPNPGAQEYTGPVTLNSSVAVRSRVLIGDQWSPITNANFVVNAIPASPANLVVSELCYDPAASGAYTSRDLEFIVLKNISGSAIDLTGVSLKGAVTFKIDATPQQLTVPAGGEVVIAANVAALEAVHGPAPSSLPVLGPFSGALDNAGEALTIETTGGTIIKQFTYSPGAPWPLGSGRSLVLVQPGVNPDHNNGHNWRSSVATRGTPYGSDSIAFAGDWAADTDADSYADGIEYSLGTAPADPASKPTINASVGTEVVNGVPGRYLRIVFRRSILNDHGAVSAELSTNLPTWIPGGFTRIQQTDHADGTMTEVWRSTNPLTASKAFGRIRVASP